MTPRTPWPVPSWQDPVVRAATGWLGGPPGRYAVIGARGLAGVASAVVALATLTLALGIWQKGHCLMKGWHTPDQFWRTCYSDLPVVHASSPLAQGHLPWADGAGSNQAPLPGLVQWLLATVSPFKDGLAAQQSVLLLWAVVALGLLIAGALAVLAIRPDRPWQAAHLAASPVVALSALVSVDLLGVTLTLLALLAWRRGQVWLSGGLLGLALLVRPFPLIFLAALAMLAWRHRDRLAALQVLVGALTGALVVVLPLVMVEPDALFGLEYWWRQGPGYGALSIVPQLVAAPLASGVAVWIAATGWLLALAVGAWWVWRPGRRIPDVVRLSAAMMLVVVLSAPSLSAQSGLWILPLLALSGLPWRDHLVWAAAEGLHFVAVWLHIAYSSDAGRGLPPLAYAIIIVIRVAAWAWLLQRIARESRAHARVPDRAQRRVGVTS